LELYVDFTDPSKRWDFEKEVAGFAGQKIILTTEPPTTSLTTYFGEKASTNPHYISSFFSEHNNAMVLRFANPESMKQFEAVYKKKSGYKFYPLEEAEQNRVKNEIKKNKEIVSAFESGKAFRGGFGGLGPGRYPAGYTKTDFTWEYYGKEYPMHLVGGFLGVHQLENGALRPAIGYAIAHNEKTTKD